LRYCRSGRYDLDRTSLVVPLLQLPKFLQLERSLREVTYSAGITLGSDSYGNYSMIPMSSCPYMLHEFALRNGKTELERVYCGNNCRQHLKSI